MHVVILSHNYPYPLDHTFGFFCKQQAEALAGLGVRVGAVVPLLYSIKHILHKRRALLGPDSFEERDVNAELFYLPSPPKAKRLKYLLIRQIGKYLFARYIKKYGKPDVVHLHNFLAAEVAEWILKVHHIPIVYTEHFSELRNEELLSGKELNLVRLAIATAKVRIAVSHDFADLLSTRWNAPFEFVPNVYDDRVFKLMRKPPATPFRFIHVGHLSELKNQVGLLRAFHQSFSGSSTRIAFVGAGVTGKLFRDEVAKLELGLQVDLYESLLPAGVANEMSKSHALVLASKHETFGVVLIEAMACGLPVLSTMSGGPQSIITDEKLGLLVGSTEAALAKGMRRMFDGYAAFDREHIASHAKENYSYNAVGASLIGVYQRCV